MQSRKPSFFSIAASAVLIFFLTTAVPSTSAATETVLRNFGHGTDGSAPYATLVFDNAGNLYGTTAVGGSDGDGTVFQLMPSGDGKWAETVLHSFKNDGHDGYWPYSSLVFDEGGNLYGTTTRGGTYDSGTVFELSPQGNGNWGEKVLYSFQGGEDGAVPDGGVIVDSAGNLYGTTYQGGSTGCGSVGCGTVFELRRRVNLGWTEKLLHRFGTNGKDGNNPYAGLIMDAAGNLYGTTVYGGAVAAACFGFGCGTAFELTRGEDGGWTEQILHSFCSVSGCGDGANPYGGLIFDTAANLYGTTLIEGGGNGCGGGCGAIFELVPGAGGSWTENVLYSFGSAADTDGFYPFSTPSFDAAGNLYATAEEAGDFGCGNYGCGTVVRLTPGANGIWTEETVFIFNGGDGGLPRAGVIFDTSGNAYGTTNGGGANGHGTVFEISP